MNYHGYLVFRGADPGSGWFAELFDSRTGALSTRFAATFVLVAGVGITLMTRRVVADVAAGIDGAAERLVEMRWRLVRRGLVLYVLGEFLDVIWRGTIITYYGAMFVVAALLFTASTRVVAAVGVVAAIAGSAINIWMVQQRLDGEQVTWLTNPGNSSVRRYVFDLFVNGTHPLLPWLAFLCAGIIVGRLLESPRFLTSCAGVGMALFGASLVLEPFGDTPLREVSLSADPISRSLVYVSSALGTALLAFAVISAIVERIEESRPGATDPLRTAGQMTLTIYLAHILVFNLLVDWLEWIEPAGLALSLVFSAVFWMVAILGAVLWDERYGRGPAERVYRRLGA